MPFLQPSLSIHPGFGTSTDLSCLSHPVARLLICLGIPTDKIGYETSVHCKFKKNDKCDTKRTRPPTQKSITLPLSIFRPLVRRSARGKKRLKVDAAVPRRRPALVDGAMCCITSSFPSQKSPQDRISRTSLGSHSSSCANLLCQSPYSAICTSEGARVERRRREWSRNRRETRTERVRRRKSAREVCSARQALSFQARHSSNYPCQYIVSAERLRKPFVISVKIRRLMCR